MEYALRNDKIMPKADITISLEDRGYQFGDGIYEVIRFYDGELFHLDAHLARLDISARQINLTLPLSMDALARRLKELTALSKIGDGKIYLQITRGVSRRAHAFPEETEPLLTAYTEEVARPLSQLATGIGAITVQDNRWLRVDIKSLNLLPNVLAKQKAKEAGAVEAIFIRDGHVTEASASNVFGIRNGVIYTHPVSPFILNGITRQALKVLAEKVGIQWVDEAFTEQELMEMDEVIMTNTVLEVCPVISINGQPVGKGQPGQHTIRLQQAFAEEIAVLKRGKVDA
ncbi:D-amino-acid transaminase [Paenibacillus beijingensis]|uniref:D-alanine aminotransferase n=1 Tax=Paenibacillus beijingensis TaxID=1126833 RepID=A0A0D5NI74_9BACL|nr:D-amino-acid transaminase [Paenibacillus beijingensis]AJY75099.1 hypothetical protein VN24_11575 [Paenibacillus beijingensis]